jgi:hypothetical protein
MKAAMHKCYVVQLWGSDPSEGNDDHMTMEEYATIEAARVAFNLLKNGDWTGWGNIYKTSAHTVVLGEDVIDAETCTINHNLWRNCEHCVTMEMEKFINPSHKPSKDDDDEWRSEQRMQAGMAFGTQGYNDYEGYDEGSNDF